MLYVRQIKNTVVEEAPFVAEIPDIDLRGPVDDTLFHDICDAWSSYPVLVFPDQDLDAKNHQAFAERFGKLQSRARPVAERGTSAQDNSNLMLVTNLRDDQGKPMGSEQNALQFHSDGCFNEFPSLATLLYGIEVPEHGGETLFVSMSQVFKALSQATRDRLVGKGAVNYYFIEYEKHRDSDARARSNITSPSNKIRSSIHPAIIAHPVTRNPMVFINRHNSREIIGISAAESRSLLEEVFATIERPEFIYAHKWRKGDLVVWDNRAVQHARADYPLHERRLLRRFAVVCPARPQPYVQ